MNLIETPRPPGRGGETGVPNLCVLDAAEFADRGFRSVLDEQMKNLHLARVQAALHSVIPGPRLVVDGILPIGLDGERPLARQLAGFRSRR